MGLLLPKYRLISAFALIPAVIAALFIAAGGFATLPLGAGSCWPRGMGTVKRFSPRVHSGFGWRCCGLLLALMLFLLLEYHHNIRQPLVEMSLWGIVRWWVVALPLRYFIPVRRQSGATQKH